jgi:hypothetical protein
VGPRGADHFLVFSGPVARPAVLRMLSSVLACPGGPAWWVSGVGRLSKKGMAILCGSLGPGSRAPGATKSRRRARSPGRRFGVYDGSAEHDARLRRQPLRLAATDYYFHYPAFLDNMLDFGIGACFVEKFLPTVAVKRC